ncbi:MAG: EAL domain-containing protein [Rhodoferax sp.]|nr:EAL domain-containing protein [Rhodoferax sp.]
MASHSPLALKQISGWQLNALIVVGTLLLTNVVVALVDWLLLGRVDPDTLKVSTISGLIIATLVVSVAGQLRARLAAANQHQLELGIERAQSHLALAIESAQMIFWEFDLESGQFTYDKGRRAWLGLPLEVEANSLNEWMALVHPDDLAPFMQRFQAAQAVGAPDFQFDYRMRQADGSWGWVHTRGRVKERNAQGLPVLAVGGTLNIHQRKQADLALQENKERLDIIFNDNPELMLISRMEDGLITEVNQAFVRKTGFSRAQAIGNTTLELGLWVHPQDRQRMTAALLAQARCVNLETFFVTRSGEQIDSEIDAICTPMHGVPHIICTVRDIRARKRALAEQQRSEQAIGQLNLELTDRNQFLSALMEAIPIPIFYKDEQGVYLGFNKAYEDFIGLSRTDLVGKSVFDIAPAHLAEIYHAQDLALMAHRGLQRYETQVKNGAGELREVMFSKSCFTDHQGQVKGLIGGLLDITERKLAEQSLQNSERRTQSLYSLLRLVTDNVPDMIWAKDLDKRYLFANKAICEQLLLAQDTDEPVGKSALFFAQRQRASHPDNPHWHTFGELCQDSDALTLTSGQAGQFDEFGNVSGQPLYLDVRKAPLTDEHGQVIGVVGTARDVTVERATQEKLRIAAAVLANSSEALVLSDADNHIIDVNPAYTRLTGYTLAEVAGKDPGILHSGKHDKAFYRDMWAQINATGSWQGEIWNRRKDGQIYAEWLTINTLYNDDASVHRRVGLFSDITDKKRSEELVWTQANFDTLTGLPNRRMFLDRLEQDLKKAHRGGFKLALMFVDLDHFKEINDTLGHAVGDQLLKQAAERIAACARESDTVARIGGDEFTVILAELLDTTGIDRVAQNILVSLARPFEIGPGPCFVSASIGITLYPSDSLLPQDLMKNADQAMYVSKDTGRNRFSYFTRAMQSAAMYRLHLQEDLRQALAEQQFVLHYQPIVALPSGQIHKAEALLRWTHPVRGTVGPAEFIPVAEDCGLIHALGDWVFAQACAQAKAWRTRLDPGFQVSVNLSPLQLQTGAEQFHWRAHMQAQQLSGAAVVLEITEGLLLDKSAAVTAELLAYRDAGIQVAIDDFGTGYSAMAYLKQLDIDYLKIDRSFVRNLGLQTSDHALCEAIVVMAHKLGLRVIAEGVETAVQRDLLQAMGCDFAQGYLFAKALPPDEFERFVRN